MVRGSFVVISNLITTKRKLILFRARTRMLNVNYNFGQKIKCPLCKIGEDAQKHLLECLVIKITCPEILNNTKCNYTDLISDNLE